ncbi:hypothetical protein [Paraburkholderia atlantica]|nr:hypothetical protein [Paraburkholderia atlantica]
MLDAAICSAMVLGEPRVTLAALHNLHQLLVDLRLRGNSPDGSTNVREKRNEQSAKRRSSRSTVIAVDAASDEPDVRRGRASGNERSATGKHAQASRMPVDAGCGHLDCEGA